MKEIIKHKKPNIEFYLNNQTAIQRYEELMKEERDIYLDPLFNGKLWVITWY